MKMKKIKLFSVVLVAFIGFLLTSCEKSDNTSETALDKISETTLDKNLLKSAKKYTELVEERKTGPGGFVIEDIKRNANILTIKVKGGCKEEDFHIVWDGLIFFSYPGQINLVLYNDALGECEMENKFNITVNLSKIVENQNPKDFIFNVANGSVKQDMSLNINGSISNK